MKSLNTPTRPPLLDAIDLHLLALLPFGVAGTALALRQIPTQRLRLIGATALALIGLAHGVGLWLLTVGRYFA